MKVDEVALKGFALHQTFPPRFGWLKKAFDIASEDPKVFSDQEATVKLGVGKNMVDAIAFWAQAFRILDVEKSPKKKESSRYIPSSFGQLMFDEDFGLDPYLEIPHSLWLLHWMSLQPTTKLPTWWLTFSEFARTEFSAEDLVEFVFETVLVTSWKYDNRKAVLRDVDCLLRMYSPRVKKNRLTVDDYLDSPFRDLGIIGPSSLNRGEYRFHLGDKPNLDAKLVLLACIHFMARQKTSSATVPHLLSDSGAPGKVFRLTEGTLSNYLHDGVMGTSGVKIASPAGVTQLIVEIDPLDVVEQLLCDLYSFDNASSTFKKLVASAFISDSGRDLEPEITKDVQLLEEMTDSQMKTELTQKSVKPASLDMRVVPAKAVTTKRSKSDETRSVSTSRSSQKTKSKTRSATSTGKVGRKS